MAIEKEIWSNQLADLLFKEGNEFLELCRKEDDMVLAGKVVHRTNNNEKPGAEKNRTQYPATVTKRSAIDAVYVLDQYTTDPEVIQSAEIIELSYDKSAEMLRSHNAVLLELMAQNALYDWLAADVANNYAAAYSAIRTSGDTVLAHLTGATGNRKAFIEADLQKMKFYFNKMKVPANDRYALIPSDMFDQLITSLKSKDFAFAKDAINGSVPTLHGFRLIERVDTMRYNNAGTPALKTFDSNTGLQTEATTDNDSVICWQRDMVTRARGSVQVYFEQASPIYHGDIVSAEIRFKAQKFRADAVGIAAIVQASA